MGLARGAGVGVEDLGLAPAGVGTGLAIGGLFVGAVVGAGLFPASRPLFADRRMAGVGLLGTAYRAAVRIPLGTVLVEEVAFRGVLLALVGRLVSLGGAVLVSSALFGLWHLVPVRATLRTNGLPSRPATLVVAAVALTIVGGGLCWLRLSTGGLWAPAIVHASASAAATVVAAHVPAEGAPS